MSTEYDAIAEQYAKYRTIEVGMEPTLRWLNGLSPKGTILDLGCGSGKPLAQLLEEKNFKVTGVDSSPRMIEFCNSNLNNAELICTPVQEYSFPDSHFDGVLSWGLMFLLSESDQIDLLFNVAKMLKSQGSFLFTSPPMHCVWEDILSKQASISLGREDYINYLAEVGLEIQWEWEEPKYQNYYYSAIKKA
ncbi:MAG: methyltransferase domain-containing protein [Pseudomonadales bacterium]|nr:methyltransferase domain-containing protein [Pseudomonadales bacterium]